MSTLDFWGENIFFSCEFAPLDEGGREREGGKEGGVNRSNNDRQTDNCAGGGKERGEGIGGKKKREIHAWNISNEKLFLFFYFSMYLFTVIQKIVRQVNRLTPLV
jgi:hypothetical protein